MDSSPLQKALEETFPDLKLFVSDFGERIFVKVYISTDRGPDELTFSTPHTLNAESEPWQYWFSRFTTQISRRLK